MSRGFDNFSEENLMIEAIVWAIQNRKDDVHIHFYGKISASFCQYGYYRLAEALKDKKCKIDNFTIKKSEFMNMSGDKGIIDLRRLISDEERFFTHKSCIERGIITVIVTEDKRPIIADKAYYDMRMKMLEEEDRQAEKRRQQREKDLRKQRTKREYDKYYISEETGCMYFSKPIDLERFSISSRLL